MISACQRVNDSPGVRARSGFNEERCAADEDTSLSTRDAYSARHSEFRGVKRDFLAVWQAEANPPCNNRRRGRVPRGR